MSAKRHHLNVLVLAGGPDRERPVSLESGRHVAQALRQAGHAVRLRDCLPDDLSALDDFVTWRGDIIFPVLHGAWGEGGGLESVLEARGLPYVGSGAVSSALCMDKYEAKRAFEKQGLPTPAFELLEMDQCPTLEPPVVVKAVAEGSSFDLVICHDKPSLASAISGLRKRHRRLLIERYVVGYELTVGVLGRSDIFSGEVGELAYVAESEDCHPVLMGERCFALPVIQIKPHVAFYNYEAKYERDDTQYLIGSSQMRLPESVLTNVQALSLKAHEGLACRHLSRVDVMLDGAMKPWILEINTLPGFTSHSLLPMASQAAGWRLPRLVDYLARLAWGEARNI